MKIRNSLIKRQAVMTCLFYMQVITSAYVVPVYASIQQLPIVVLICSYNNQEWVNANLDSVFIQEYDNFKVLYIDDCSSDTTASRVLSYSDTHNLAGKITLMCNKTRCRKMKNIYTAIHSCDDQDIIVQLDGDDWFIDNQLFTQLNELYQTQDIWLTYGSDTLGYAQPTPPNVLQKYTYRSEKWIYAPTRSFYAWLFKAINLEDLIAEHVQGYQGQFFPSADDVAFMYPMLEMAGSKIQFIPHVNYYVNRDNPLNNKKVDCNLQEASSLDIRTRAPYKPLAKPNIGTIKRSKQALADILITSDDAHDLLNLLASITEFVTHVGSVSIIHTTQHTEHKALQSQFPGYTFIAAESDNIDFFINHCSMETNQTYLVLAHSTTSITKPIDLSACMSALEITGAHGFYLSISADQLPGAVQHICDEIYTLKLAWYDNTIALNSDMTLLRAHDLFTKKSIHSHAVGLCLAHAPVKGSSFDIRQNVYLPALCQVAQKPTKKRRLHVPSRDPRTKEKNKSNKSTHKETLS